MDPKERQYETIVARRPIVSDEEIAEMAKAINEADRRDGTLELLDTMFDEFVEDEGDTY